MIVLVRRVMKTVSACGISPKRNGGRFSMTNYNLKGPTTCVKNEMAGKE